MGKFASRNASPIKYFGRGCRSVAGELEPERVVELAGEEQVGVIALGDVRVLILEAFARGGSTRRSTSGATR